MVKFKYREEHIVDIIVLKKTGLKEIYSVRDEKTMKRNR
jgi:hypothetical protein